MCISSRPLHVAVCLLLFFVDSLLTLASSRCILKWITSEFFKSFVKCLGGALYLGALNAKFIQRFKKIIAVVRFVAWLLLTTQRVLQHAGPHIGYNYDYLCWLCVSAWPVSTTHTWFRQQQKKNGKKSLAISIVLWNLMLPHIALWLGWDQELRNASWNNGRFRLHEWENSTKKKETLK